MKYLITIILTALVVGGAVAGYYQGWFPILSPQRPQAVSVQNTEVTDIPVTPTSSPAPFASASATPKTDDKQTVLAAVKAALIAKRGPDFANLNYSLNKIEGLYASGTVNGSGGGGMWFAANVNNVWKIVSDGNGVTMCSDLTPYINFPKSMIPECWDSLTNKLITR